MRHCGRGSGCSQHYLNYDAKVYNWSLPRSATTAVWYIASAVSAHAQCTLPPLEMRLNLRHLKYTDTNHSVVVVRQVLDTYQ